MSTLDDLRFAQVVGAPVEVVTLDANYFVTEVDRVDDAAEWVAFRTCDDHGAVWVRIPVGEISTVIIRDPPPGAR